MSPLLSKLLQENAKKIKCRLEPKSGKNQYIRILPLEISSKLPKLVTTKKASVIVPLLDNGDEKQNHLQNLSILFTRRAKTLKQHANEISFPGGHYDAALDGESLLNTALRETREELLPSMEKFNIYKNEKEFTDPRYDFWKNLIVLGQAETIPSAKLVPVTPFFAYFKYQISNVEDLFPGNADEVDKVFTVSIQELLEVETSMHLKRLGMEGPVYRTKHGNIWGMTALILKPILHEVLKPAFMQQRR